MTKLQFISELLGTINLLLETDVNCCSAHQARILLDSIFDKFEELGDAQASEPNTCGDLEHYSYIIENLHDKGFNLYLEENAKPVTTEKAINALDHLFPNLVSDLNALTIIPKMGGTTYGV